MVQPILLDVINESVDTALEKAKMDNTTENRVSVLSGMHQRLSKSGQVVPEDRSILQAIEDEIVRLQDES